MKDFLALLIIVLKMVQVVVVLVTAYYVCKLIKELIGIAFKKAFPKLAEEIRQKKELEKEKAKKPIIINVTVTKVKKEEETQPEENIESTNS